jgi:hypothetical protein
MRGSRAKKLRRLAAEYVVGAMKKSAGEGYNEYHQAMNHIEWEPMLDPETGYPVMVGGQATLKPAKHPGTITCAWHVRVMYQQLKKQWVRSRR